MATIICLNINYVKNLDFYSWTSITEILKIEWAEAHSYVWKLWMNSKWTWWIWWNLVWKGEAFASGSIFKYLGLWIDFRLDFSTHIKRITKSVAPIIGVLKRIRPYVIAEILDNLYFAYVHSRLSYMVSIWGMATQDRINSLQLLQNRDIKNLRQLPFRFPTKELFSE
jgi:hypothetical protein